MTNFTPRNGHPQFSGLRWLCFLSIVILAGCAALERAGERPIGKVGRIGVYLCPSDAGLQVVDVKAGSPAEAAGVMPGDTILRVNGVDLRDSANRSRAMPIIRSGQVVALSVMRENAALEVKVRPILDDMFAIHPLIFALDDEKLVGRKMSVAVVVTEINHAGTESPPAGWKAGIKAWLEAELESILLGSQGRHCGNFSVVDRSRTNEILNELRFQMTGAVDPKLMREVGRMTGATHLIFASLTRFGDPAAGWNDATHLRLVDVGSGNVLATASQSQIVR